MSVSVNEFYKIYNPEADITQIGKITTVEQHNDVCFFTVYTTPSALSKQHATNPGVKNHHSAFELFKTDIISKEFLVNVKEQVQVLRDETFRSQYCQSQSQSQSQSDSCSNQQKQIQLKQIEGKVYFYRQRWLEETRTLEPELHPICVCQQVWSPDQDDGVTNKCPHCGYLFHPMCMRQHSDLRCYQCRQTLPKALVYTHPRPSNNNNNSQPVNDNNADDDQDIDNNNDEFNYESKRQKTSATTTTIQQQHVAETQQNSHVNAQKQTQQAYPSLSAEDSEKLQEVIAELKKCKLEERVALSSSRTEETRYNARESLTHAMLLAEAEAGNFSSPKKEILKKARNTAMLIEASLYAKHSKEISREYAKQFRQLQSALINAENTELRQKIAITQSLQPFELIVMTAAQLAPPDKQQMQEDKSKASFEANVLPDVSGNAKDFNKGASALYNPTVVYTAAGIEFMGNSPKSKGKQQPTIEEFISQPNFDKEDDLAQNPEVKPDQAKEEVENCSLVQSHQNHQQQLGMTNEAYELFKEVTSKWNFESLKVKFEQRLNEQLQTNSYTRLQILEKVQQLVAQDQN